MKILKYPTLLILALLFTVYYIQSRDPLPERVASLGDPQGAFIISDQEKAEALRRRVQALVEIYMQPTHQPTITDEIEQSAVRTRPVQQN